MGQLQIFINHKFGQIRMIEAGGKPYAVGVDVARMLEYAEPHKAIAAHCRGGISYPVIDSLGRTQETNIIPEGDIYRLIVKAADQSKNPDIKAKAEEIEKWIFDEVLPSIRKHGMYAKDELLDNPDLLIEIANKLKQERAARIAAESKVKELTPAAEFGNAIGNCQDAVLIRDFAKVLANAEIKIGQDRLFSWLHTKGYLYRDKASRDWRPYQRYVDMGLFKVTEKVIGTNTRGDLIKYTTKVTGKGQRYFFEKLKEIRKEAR